MFRLCWRQGDEPHGCGGNKNFVFWTSAARGRRGRHTALASCLGDVDFGGRGKDRGRNHAQGYGAGRARLRNR